MKRTLIWISAALCAITVRGEYKLRTLPFREVLHSVADKMGLDPEQSNFLTNQAIPIGKSIDQWIRRTYDSQDFPEWTRTTAVTPTNHIVPYDVPVLGVGGGGTGSGPSLIHIYRVLSVFLVDPKTTEYPVETEFTLLPEGVHVGFDHGTQVWIKYIELPPRYTAERWQPDHTYQKDDVAYSYTTGEVYKSRVNGNIGHDPRGTFQTPPNVDIVQEPVPLLTEIVQEMTNGNPGVGGRPEILVIDFANASPAPPPPPTPIVGTEFYVGIFDTTGATLGEIAHVATGAETMTDILTAIATGIDALLPASFVVTLIPGTDTLRFEDNSEFTAYAQYVISGPGYQIRTFAIFQTASFLPPVPGTPGVPQESQLTITPDKVVGEGIYAIKIIDSTGTEHLAQYTAYPSDSELQILRGLSDAMAASTDEFLNSVVNTIDDIALTMLLRIGDKASVNADLALPGSPWWELVPFPRTLANTVIRGAYADLLKEWGQSTKGAAEEQAVPQEAGVAAGKFQTTPNPELTNQQRPLSRYRLQ